MNKDTKFGANCTLTNRNLHFEMRAHRQQTVTSHDEDQQQGRPKSSWWSSSTIQLMCDKNGKGCFFTRKVNVNVQFFVCVFECGMWIFEFCRQEIAEPGASHLQFASRGQCTGCSSSGRRFKDNLCMGLDVGQCIDIIPRFFIDFNSLMLVFHTKCIRVSN